jgi:prepilin-type N-terminal cleavage/methylation domain-containing protein/prepilin-type processing-associated H-X9-DG protein
MKRRKAGFTLVELLIVLAIVGVLAALLFPVFARAREQARKTSCQANQKQILLAVTMYVQDYDGLFPKIYYHDVSGQIVTWYETLLPYTKSQQVFQCPTDSGTKVGGSWKPAPKFRSSYAASYDLLWGDSLSEYAPSAPMSRARKPATTVFLSDAGVQTESEAPFVTTSSVDKDGCWLIWLSSNSAMQGDGSICGPSLRHSGMSNVGFVDGHVKAMKVENWFFEGSNWTTSVGG